MKYLTNWKCAAVVVWVGLCLSLRAPGDTGELLAYEGFDAIGGPLDGTSGTTSFGWAGEWESHPSHLVVEEGVGYNYIRAGLLHFDEDLSGNGLRDVWRWGWPDFIVLHFDFDEDQGTIYVNPVAGVPDPVESKSVFRMYFEGTFSFDSDFVLSRFGVTHNFYPPLVADVRIDEIRIAESYAALTQLPDFAPKPMRGAVTRLTRGGTEVTPAGLPDPANWVGSYAVTVHPDFGVVAHSDKTDAFYAHSLERWLYPVMFTPGEYYLYDPENDQWWWSADGAGGHYWSVEEEAWQHLPEPDAKGGAD